MYILVLCLEVDIFISFVIFPNSDWMSDKEHEEGLKCTIMTHAGRLALVVCTKEFGQGHGFRVRLGTRPQVRIQDLGKGAAPASEAKSCWHSEVELCEQSKSFVARVQGPLNSSRADFQFFRKSNMFQIATTSSITRVSLCQPDLVVISILYSMPISDFLVPISINRFALAAIFYPDIS